MKQQDKDLLLRDLSARQSYGVRCQFIRTYCNETTDGEDVIVKEECKPYLRPMSSMTSEEFEEYTKLIKPIVFNKIQVNMASPESFDYLNKKMFDYRGLIDKGLALKAPDGMYN